MENAKTVQAEHVIDHLKDYARSVVEHAEAQVEPIAVAAREADGLRQAVGLECAVLGSPVATGGVMHRGDEAPALRR